MLNLEVTEYTLVTNSWLSKPNQQLVQSSMLGLVLGLGFGYYFRVRVRVRVGVRVRFRFGSGLLCLVLTIASSVRLYILWIYNLMLGNTHDVTTREGIPRVWVTSRNQQQQQQHILSLYGT